MKHSLLSIVISFVFISIISAQTVDSIKIEQSGDFIKIRYKILNSSSDQLFKVRVLCSINGGLNTEIRTVSGDVGDMVAGGKNEYFAIWDVLKDIEELKSAEFIVRAELVKDISDYGSRKPPLWANERTHLLALIELKKPIFGLRFAYCGSFGISVKALYGKRQELTQQDIYGSKNVYSLSLDLTKRIINSNAFQMHLMAGIAMAKVPVIDYGTPESPGLVYSMLNQAGGEVGLLLDIKRISVSICVGKISEQAVPEPWEAVPPFSFLNFGIGARF